MSTASNLKINTELVKLEQDSLLSFFEIDTSTIINEPIYKFTGIIYKFHNYHIRPEDSNATDLNDKKQLVLVWKGEKYYYYPIEATGFDLTGDGSLPRPIIRIANIFPEMKNLTINFGDLVGAKITRRRTFKKFLDNQDTSDPLSEISEDIYYISRKKIENKLFIEFELTTFIERNNLKLPRRVILRNYCPWSYKQSGCNFEKPMIINNQNEVIKNYISEEKRWEVNTFYKEKDCVYFLFNGIRYFQMCKQDHTSTYGNRRDQNYWIFDQCNKTLKACKLRFSSERTLPFGGFPGTTQL